MRIVPKSARPGFVSTPRSRKCLARHPRRSLRAGLSRYGRRQERARVRNPGGTAWTCEARRPWSRGGVERDRACDGTRAGCPGGDLGPLRTQRGTFGGARRSDCVARTCAAGRPGCRSVQARRRRIPRCPGSRGIGPHRRLDQQPRRGRCGGPTPPQATTRIRVSSSRPTTGLRSPSLARFSLRCSRGAPARSSASLHWGPLPRFRVRGTTLRPRQPSRSRPRPFVPSYMARAYA